MMGVVVRGARQGGGGSERAKGEWKRGRVCKHRGESANTVWVS